MLKNNSGKKQGCNPTLKNPVNKPNRFQKLQTILYQMRFKRFTKNQVRFQLKNR